MTSRRWRVVLLVAACGALVVAVMTARLFIQPSTDPARPVDAVVLFVGGRGERLELAERLMDAGLADNLVVPNGLDPGWPEGNQACREARRYRAFCPEPDPDTTRGEARTIASLAEAEGWRSVLVVTSTYQLSRAGLLLARCFDGEVLTTDAAPDLGPPAWARRIVHEWFGWAKAMTIDRTC